MHNKVGWKNSVCLSLFCVLQRYIAWIAVFCNPTYCGQKYRLEKIISLTGAIVVPSKIQDSISFSCIVGRIRPTNRAGKCAKSVYGTVLLALLLAIVSNTAFAACSAWRSPQKVWFNEYFFGSGGGAPPNFLEIYSTSNSFPSQWSGMSLEVYSGANTKTTHPLNNSTALACSIASKTWLTYNAVGGLVSQKALVILRDSAGDAVDAYAFDNTSPPAPWAGAANNWAPSNTTGCTALDTALTTQAGLSGTTPKQANMLVLGSYGNKDMARTPDGGAPWDVTSNTGAGTTYTQCVSNNANFIKTVDNSTPSPGTTVTFTLSLTNIDSIALTGVTLDDFLPDYPVAGAPSFISAIPVNALDTVTQTTYVTTDPNTATAGNATKIQWAPASIAPGATAKLIVKMQVPANATQGYVYTNTAQTTGSVLSPNQTDFASITVGSPNVGSFVFSVSPGSASTCATPLLGPKVTITAMTGPNGTGSVDTAYVGNSVYLSASTPNPKWYNSAGTLLATVSPVPAGSFVNGVATFYLKDTTAETITVSGLDSATYTPNVMQGASGNISFISGSAGLVLVDGETLAPASAYSVSNPAYGVVMKRPHPVRATISSCGATDTTKTGSYSGTIGYTVGLNHPAGATAPTISTTSSCPGVAVGATTLTFASGISDFYLCTSDVGQFALDLTLSSPSVTGSTSNFTVRPFAITARNFAAGATVNPQGTGAFTSAGGLFSGTFDAWGWRSTEDANSNGVPDAGVLTSAFSVATHGQPLRFSGTTNAAGVINFAAKSPATGTLAPTTATATAGSVTLSNLTYSEVGDVTFAGADVSGLYGATDYLGMSGLDVPLLSDVVGHFTATTIATGSDPVANTVAPGSSATDVNFFTLQTNSGSETITSVTINLSTNSGVGRLAITDNSDAELGFTASPVTGSNTITVTGMTATTALGAFKVRVTPLSHAAMPVPVGGSYDITAPVTAWAGTNAHRGSDTNTNALTIDNLSPAGASTVSSSAGNANVSLNWTTSAATDFSTTGGSIIYRWAAGTAGSEVPVEGSTPVVGSSNGTATVACVVSSVAASTAVAGKIDGTGAGSDCTTAALTNGQTYTYKIFQKDSSGNYDTGVLVGTLTPSATTLADGVNPSSVTIAPGAAITDLDAFTLKTDASTDTVTAVTVTLGPAGAFNNIAQVDLTDNSNTARCTAVTNPAGNTLSFTTCASNGGIPVTTSVTTYKIRITPKTHANMDAPPGASYATTGTVTAFTSTHSQAGTDAASATITVDNASPASATAVSGSAGDAKVTLNWTTSAATDFSTTGGSVIYRWAAGTAGSEVPVEGSTPVVGSSNGTATVACVVSSAAASTAVAGKVDGAGAGSDCTTAALTNGQTYTYKVFQKDSNGNFDTGALVGTLTPSITTIADGVNPSSVTIAPGAAITDLDAFTLKTDASTDTVTAVTVTLGPAGAFNNIAQVDLTDNSNTARCTAVTNPAGNTISFTACAIPVTTSVTTYKIRITPKTHANMDAPPGASYATTGTVTAFTSTYPQAGTDAASAVVTIDNASPAGATAVSASIGDAKVTLNWTTSAAADFSTTGGSVVYRWAAGTAGTEVPVEGSTPVVGSSNGTATVACVVSSAAASTAVAGKIDGTGGSADCTTAALTNGTTYTYKVFQKDSNGNYDLGVVMGMVTKSFSDDTIVANGTSTLSIIIRNPGVTAISGLAFTDTYPSSNLKNAATPALTNTCGGTATGTAGASVLSLSGGSVAAGGSCSISINVTAVALGSYTNSTLVTWTNGGSGATASATLTVSPIMSITNPVPVNEGNSGTQTLSFVVSLDSISGNNATANYTTSDGTATGGVSCTAGIDYVTQSGTVTIAAGQTAANIDITLCGDTNIESDETFTVALSVPINAIAGSSSATGTILNDDTATSGFNGCEATVPQCAPPTSGYAALYTKLVGTAFNLEGVALKSDGTLDSGFSGSVAVSLLANLNAGVALTGNCPNSQDAIISLGNQTFSSGRVSISGGAINTAYRDVRMRFTCTPAVCGSVISVCSSDNFAVRPGAATLLTTANAPAPSALSSAITTTTPVIKAGAAFTIGASTSTGATDGYVETLTLDATKLSAQLPSNGSTLASGGEVGTLTVNPAVQANASPAQSNNATWTEVGYLYAAAGAFRDDGFTSVDQAAGDCIVDSLDDVFYANKIGCSIGNKTGISLGRFIPDHFALTQGTPIPGCGTFTYFGQDGFSSDAFTLTAQNSSNSRTKNYTGSFAKLPLTIWADFGFTATSPPAGSVLSASATAPTGSWSNGVATVTAKHQLSRPTASIGETNIVVQAAPIDSDGVTMAAANIASGTPLRYGRLSLQNAYGSELLILPLSLAAEYWNGTSWVNNDADSCTTFPASSISMGNYLQNLSACETQFSPAGSLTMSGGTSPGLKLTAPGAGNTGSVDLTLNIGSSASGNTCTSSTETSAQPASMSWFGVNPTARATFGIYKGNSKFIYIRELY